MPWRVSASVAALLFACLALAGSRDAVTSSRNDATAAAAAAAPMWPFDGLSALFGKKDAAADKEAGLRGLPETPAAAFGSGSLGADAYLAPDLYRGHKRPLIKTKLCLRCTQRVSVKQLAQAAAERSRKAVEAAKAASAAEQRAAAAAEAQKEAEQAKTGDPDRDTDSFDKKRLAKERKQDKCLKLPREFRQACLDEANGPGLTLPNPANVPGLPPAKPPSRIALPDARADPWGASVDPRLPFKPPSASDAVNADKLAQNGFGLTFLELGGGGGGGGGAADAAGAAPGALLETGAGEPDGGMVLASLPICANEGSRQFIYSLFRGVVGALGVVECVDIPAPLPDAA